MIHVALINQAATFNLIPRLKGKKRKFDMGLPGKFGMAFGTAQARGQVQLQPSDQGK